MSKIDERFQELQREGRKAFVPFVTAGDPDLDFTQSLVQTLDRQGATICEIGIPYSDPIADGPVIQASYTRALKGGAKVPEILDAIEALGKTCSAPIVTMVSYAIVWRMGIDAYVERAKSAGVSGLIVPDLLLEEAEPLAKACSAADLSLIQLVTPTTPADRAVRVAELSTGFLYYVSVTGITGAAAAQAGDVGPEVARIKAATDLPVIVGFGIKTPDAAEAIAKVADGAVVGSAIVEKIGAGESTDDILSFVASLAEGAHRG